MGGWRRWFAPLKGGKAGRLHVELARVAVVGLTLSALTALWMSAETFEFIEIAPADPGFAEGTKEAAPMPLAQMPALAGIPVSALRSLSPPDPTWPGDTLAIETATGAGLVDPATGEMLTWAEAGLMQRVSETIYMLHTGEGAALLGLVLGLMALAAPAMAVTGALIWWAGRRGQPRLRGTVRANRADTVILVGSEGGSTWGFAATLGRALMQAGQSVHLAPMSAFNPERYTSAERILVLAATYGDGDAPASAKGSSTGWPRCPRPPPHRWRCWALAIAALRIIAALRRRSRRRPRHAAGRSSCRWIPWTANRRRISPAGAGIWARQWGLILTSCINPRGPPAMR